MKAHPQTRILASSCSKGATAAADVPATVDHQCAQHSRQQRLRETSALADHRDQAHHDRIAQRRPDQEALRSIEGSPDEKRVSAIRGPKADATQARPQVRLPRRWRPQSSRPESACMADLVPHEHRQASLCERLNDNESQETREWRPQQRATGPG